MYPAHLGQGMTIDLDPAPATGRMYSTVTSMWRSGANGRGHHAKMLNNGIPCFLPKRPTCTNTSVVRP